jgi:hypothetical protein
MHRVVHRWLCTSCYVTLSGHLRGLTTVLPHCPYVSFEQTLLQPSIQWYMSTSYYDCFNSPLHILKGVIMCASTEIYIYIYSVFFLSACARDPPGLEPRSLSLSSWNPNIPYCYCTILMYSTLAFPADGWRRGFYCTYATSYSQPHLSHSCQHTDYFPLCLLHGGTKGLTTHTLMPLLPIFTNPRKTKFLFRLLFILPSPRRHKGPNYTTLRHLGHSCTHTYATIQQKQNQKHVSTRFRAAFFTVAQRA